MLVFHKKLLNFEHFLQNEKPFATGAHALGGNSVLKNDLVKNKCPQYYFHEK